MKMALWAEWNGFAGRIWPMDRSLETLSRVCLWYAFSGYERLFVTPILFSVMYSL